MTRKGNRHRKRRQQSPPIEMDLQTMEQLAKIGFALMGITLTVEHEQEPAAKTIKQIDNVQDADAEIISSKINDNERSSGDAGR